MLKQAVAYYNELLEDADLAASSFQILHDGPRAQQTHLWRATIIALSASALRYREQTGKPATEKCETIWSALQKVKDAAVGDDALLDELGITEIEKELVKIDPGYKQVSPTARLDSFLTDDAYSFVELNGESPAGIAFADSATEIFESMPVMKKFAERYSVRGFEGCSKMLRVLLDCYTEFNGGKPEENPTIAIVDLKDVPTVKEFELFRDYFQSQGYTSVILLAGPARVRW
jgi:hypothetical protein